VQIKTEYSGSTNPVMGDPCILSWILSKDTVVDIHWNQWICGSSW